MPLCRHCSKQPMVVIYWVAILARIAAETKPKTGGVPTTDPAKTAEKPPPPVPVPPPPPPPSQAKIIGTPCRGGGYHLVLRTVSQEASARTFYYQFTRDFPQQNTWAEEQNGGWGKWEVKMGCFPTKDSASNFQVLHSSEMPSFLLRHN